MGAVFRIIARPSNRLKQDRDLRKRDPAQFFTRRQQHPRRLRIQKRTAGIKQHKSRRRRATNKGLKQAELTTMLKTAITHSKNGPLPKAPGVLKIPASRYFDSARFELEVDRIFKRIPLMLATTAEMPKPGDYKTMAITKPLRRSAPPF